MSAPAPGPVGFRPDVTAATTGAWAYTREGVIAEVRNLPDKLTGFRPTPRSRTLAELALHIVESGLMMSGELTRADGNFRRQSYKAFAKEYAAPASGRRSKRDLVTLLKDAHARGEKQIRGAGEVLMLQGQIALYARLAGEVPALTKLIMGE